MKLKRHPNFVKAYAKRIAHDPSLVARVHNRTHVFLRNPRHPLLRSHQLKGSKEGYRSFSVTGDIRIIYLQISEDEVVFYDIGTHNQVY